MALKTPQQYIESLRDGRVTYWDGERIDDITTHPRFKTPIAMTAKPNGPRKLLAAAEMAKSFAARSAGKGKWPMPTMNASA